MPITATIIGSCCYYPHHQYDDYCYDESFVSFLLEWGVGVGSWNSCVICEVSFMGFGAVSNKQNVHIAVSVNWGSSLRVSL